MNSLKLIASLFLISIFFISTMATAEEVTVGEIVKDSAITTQIKAKILTAEDIDSLNIKVDTDNDGIVVLTGAVKSVAEKETVHDIAHTVDGVKKVLNRLVIDPELSE